MAAVSSRTLSDSVPRSGLASTAMTRSPRRVANVAPSPTAVVVLPTPPLRLSTATRWCPPATGVLTRLMRSRRRMSAADSPSRSRPPVTRETRCRQPDPAADRLPCSSDSAVRLSDVSAGAAVVRDESGEYGREDGECGGEARPSRPEKPASGQGAWSAQNSGACPASDSDSIGGTASRP